MDWWDKYRDEQGFIDLVAAAEAHQGEKLTTEERYYLTAISEIQPIRSRQVAAMAMATAFKLC